MADEEDAESDSCRDDWPDGALSGPARLATFRFVLYASPPCSLESRSEVVLDGGHVGVGIRCRSKPRGFHA